MQFDRIVLATLLDNLP